VGASIGAGVRRGQGGEGLGGVTSILSEVSDVRIVDERTESKGGKRDS